MGPDADFATVANFGNLGLEFRHSGGGLYCASFSCLSTSAHHGDPAPIADAADHAWNFPSFEKPDLLRRSDDPGGGFVDYGILDGAVVGACFGANFDKKVHRT